MAPNQHCSYADLVDRIDHIDPKKYAATRNFLDGHVTWLSPFITHGILNTKQLGHALISKYGAQHSYKFLSELGWREFYHRTWQAQGNNIHSDIKRPQENVIRSEIPTVFLNAKTGINAVDTSITTLLETGTIHNHARMWLASLIANICQTQWQEPAAWMYYHLLDGDLASNSLSWQWIAGTFSHRKYIANQENINRYSHTSQQNTPIDLDYSQLSERTTPNHWAERYNWRNAHPTTQLPTTTLRQPIKSNETVALHSIWNLSQDFAKCHTDRHILVLEPSHFERFPISQKRINFILHWAKQIPNIEILSDEITQLPGDLTNAHLIHQEHPACLHWPGQKREREWLFPETTRAYASFSSFWKHAQQEVGLKKHKTHQ
ncbi:FAD-binding domain-containing protein [Rubritalea tangerina]|uniref:FAD-binding domain-containing protein n=2 Tax=Rubritalea tangerina TaxID=430798 RepID=A0ABW4ZBH0_9BACT